MLTTHSTASNITAVTVCYTAFQHTCLLAAQIQTYWGKRPYNPYIKQYKLTEGK